MPQSTQPNTQQSALWNDASGKAWADLQPVLDGVLAPFEGLLVDVACPDDGGSVLDIGCGAGATTLAIARRLGASGRCVGLDISGPLVTLAASRARTDGIANAEFIKADAQTWKFQEARFDSVVSRFGVMFFDDPEAAFANIRGAAKPGAKLAFFAWRSPADNHFMTAAARAAAPFLPPAPATDPDAPGQFAFADSARAARILASSGWSSIRADKADVQCEILEDDLMTYVTRLGPVGAVLRESDRATAAKIMAALPSAFEEFRKEGAFRFNAACWLVTARA
jgi:SAM-dependent methyltransferase